MQDVACDACCLINLFATNSILRIPGEASGGASLSGKTGIPQYRLHIPDQVARESLFILRPGDDDPTKLVQHKIDLQAHCQGGSLVTCSFDSDEENDWFVKLAAEVDDGEAACLAIAKCRGWAIATDDRPASRLAGELNIAVVCTAELIKKWADQTSVAVGEIEAAVRNVQMFAKFVPRKGSPEYDWWLRHLRAE